MKPCRECLVALLIFCCGTAAAQPDFSMNAGGALSAVYADTFLVTPVRTKIKLPVRIHGKEYTFLLDTGAPLMLSKELAGILRARHIGRGELIDQSGKKDSISFILTDTIRLGRTDYAGVPALVMESQPPALACLGIDGIIGSNMLRNSALTFDMAAGRVIISGGAAQQGVAGMPMQLDRQSNPYVEVHAHRAKGTIMFDSGDDSFLEIGDGSLPQWLKASRSMKVLREGYGATSAGFNGIQAQTKQSLILATDFQIAGQRFDSVAAVSTAGETRMGAALFAYGRVTLDYAGKQFYFAPYQGAPLRFLEGKWDIVGLPGEGRMTVSTIWNTALAKEAGIRAGDEILTVEGRPAGAVTLCDMITGKPFGDATTLEMSIRTAAGEVKHVTVHKQL